MAKEREILFRLNAEVGGNYRKSFQAAQQELKALTKELDELQLTQKDISAYQKQQASVDATNAKLKRLQQQYDNIQREIEETEAFSSSLENRLLSKQAAIDGTSSSLRKQQERDQQSVYTEGFHKSKRKYHIGTEHTCRFRLARHSFKSFSRRDALSYSRTYRCQTYRQSCTYCY